MLFNSYLYSMLQIADPALQDYRKNLGNQLVIDQKHIFSIACAARDDRHFRCEQYALKKILGSPCLSAFDTDDYFYPVESSKPGDLICYFNIEDEMQQTVAHMAFVKADGMIESKWGDSLCVVTHSLFGVPAVYGNAAAIYRLEFPYNKKISPRLFMDRDAETSIWRFLRDVDLKNDVDGAMKLGIQKRIELLDSLPMEK